MAKYCSVLSVNEVCELELKEMEETLNKYNVSEEDKNNLMDMVEEAYFQLHRAYASGRVLEKHTKDDFNFKTYLKEITEEEQTYPFVTREDKKEENNQ